MAALVVLTFLASASAQTSILYSKHSLSASGPGTVRAAGEQQVCIFCHTPHNASAIEPLWNRNLPVEPYQVYSSSSLDAAPGQPTGSSKLCLSCHDGTIAVGSVMSRQQPIAMAGGMTTLPPGSGNLGTDLRDDHPISFRYDAALAAKDPMLKDPAGLPSKVKLDHRQELQCTSCHDAHDNTYGSFLVMDNSQSQLCQSCHQPRLTTITGHANCSSCHQVHSAPSGPMLLRGTDPTATCGTCHGSPPAGGDGGDILAHGPNVMGDLAKLSRHAPEGSLLGGESAAKEPTCSACHEPHTMQAGTAPPPQVSPRLGKIDGVTLSGAPTAAAQFTYEVCFKCHGDGAVTQPHIPRLITQNNTRLEFAPSAVSFHPVVAAGKNPDVPSLRAGLTTGSLIACVDCHGSDTPQCSGPHGSNQAPLLSAGYETMDGTSESEAAYALCYRCHDRASILGNESFSGHSSHIVNRQTPCSVCHDAHGISSAQGNAINNAKLINFDQRVVQPDPVTGRLKYRSTGLRSGECYLSCHGTAHSPRTYPAAAPPDPAPLPPMEPTPPPVEPPPADGT